MLVTFERKVRFSTYEGEGSLISQFRDQASTINSPGDLSSYVNSPPRSTSFMPLPRGGGSCRLGLDWCAVRNYGGRSANRLLWER